MAHDEQASVRATRGMTPRRRFLTLVGGMAGAAILAACGGDTPAPTVTIARPTTGAAPTTGVISAGSVAAPTTAAGSVVADAAPAGATTGSARTVAPSVVTGAIAPAPSAAVGATQATTGSAVAPTTGGSAVAGTPPNTTGAIPTLDIESFDYGYRTVLGAVPGGWTLVRQRNTGKETHHVQFIRLRDGVTQAQLLGAIMGQNAEAAIAMLTMNVGGPGGVEPGGVSEAIINLQAGTHFLVCYIPSPDGTPHLAKGMVLPLQVTPGPTAAARLPETLGTVTMSDFAFQMPVSTTNPGKSYWNVTNTGVQPHEFIIARLQAGKMPADITRFFAGPPMGPPPFALVGGLQGVEKGMSGIAVLDLPAGEYAAICQIPDPMSGKAHLLLGMIAGLSVR